VDVSVHSEDEAKELVLSGLREAIRRRTADLDRIGLALSGGIDSIGVAFLIRALLPQKPLFTFTAGSHSRDPEILTAAEAVRELGSTHRQIVTPPTLLADTLPSLVWHLEDPYSRTESLQLWKVGEAAAGRVDVLFSGQGADSLYAGMPKYMLLSLMKRLPPLRRGLREFYTFTQLGLPPTSFTGRLLQVAKFKGTLPPVPRVRGASLPSPVPFPAVDAQFINRIMARGFQAGCAQDIQKFERPFAAFGLGYRSPFHDLGLVRSAYTITDELKIRGMQQKYILRRALESVMPSRFLSLKKFPQRMNVDQQFSQSLDQFADRVLSPSAIESRGFFRIDEIRQLRAAGRNGRYHPEAAARLWTVILTELWARQFIDERGAAPVEAAPVGALAGEM
jgi:asparagine synthase (glutamine-hydrolysing)